MYEYYRYTGSAYAGCIYFYYYSHYRDNFHLNYPGIHTCNIEDNRGNNIALSIGLYSEGFRGKSLSNFSNRTAAIMTVVIHELKEE